MRPRPSIHFRSLSRSLSRSLAASLLLSPALGYAQPASVPASLPGFRDFTAQAAIDRRFLAVPDAARAGEELRALTASPHVAASKEDYQTALYVASKFREAGLETSIIPYRAWLNLPVEVRVRATDASGRTLMEGPSREQVSADPYQEDPRVLPPFNGGSPSGDVAGEIVYANYGTLEDFNRLADDHIDLHGKIVLVRYGANFRGVKVFIAQQRGAAGVLIYSDPYDDGYFRGDMYPRGPYRPPSGVQRGSVQFIFRYPGDATTPGVASTLSLPDSERLAADRIASLPKIPSVPISSQDARPILEHMEGASVPRGWQGALPFTYHLGGTAAVRVHIVQKMDYAERTIWDVIGRVPGASDPDAWVIAGNHRDAWTYGAVDPNSGTAAMLEAVHGVGELLHSGWRPRRSVYFCSWDAEEQGLIGSTEWVEEHGRELQHAVAYFNTDVGVAGPDFEAAAVPSLKQYVRDVAAEVPSPRGGSVLAAWLEHERGPHKPPPAKAAVGNLGSGSDYTPFLQHAGVPATDIGSGGAYGVYHSVFDNYAWFTTFADPHFFYEQQQARVLGLEVLHMADADVLPYDYVAYAQEIGSYLREAKARAAEADMSLDLTAAEAAAAAMLHQAEAAAARQKAPSGDLTALNARLRAVEADLLNEQGLPDRPWYRHVVYAPGEYTGYAAVTIPGVSEAIDAKDEGVARQQAEALTVALRRAAADLKSAAGD